MMQRRSNIQSIVRSILFVTLMGMFYVFFCTLYEQDNPPLLFLTATSIFTFLLVLLNPIYGRYSYKEYKMPTVLIILLSSALAVFIRLLTFSYTDNELISVNTIGIILCNVISLCLIFAVTKSIYANKEAILASFLYAVCPTHIFLGNISIFYAVAETIIVFSVFLVLISDKPKDKLFERVTTIAAAVSFVCAIILNFSYITVLFCFFIYYSLNCFLKKATSHFSSRFLLFFSTCGIIIATSVLLDKNLNTSFWSSVRFISLPGTNLQDKFVSASDNIQSIWANNIDAGNSFITYMSTVFILVLLLAFIAGILNAMKELKTEYILLSPFPLLFTIAYIFIAYTSTTFLCTIPFLVIVASHGIYGAYTYIPLPLKERYTGNIDIPAPIVELDESFTIPGRWGHILKCSEEHKPVQINTEPMCSEQQEPIQIDAESMCSEQQEPIHIDAEPICSEQQEPIHIDAEPICSEQQEPIQIDAEPICSELGENNDSDSLSFVGNNLFDKDGSISFHAKRAAIKKAYDKKNIQISKMQIEKEKEENDKIDTMVKLLYENKDGKKIK